MTRLAVVKRVSRDRLILLGCSVVQRGYLMVEETPVLRCSLEAFPAAPLGRAYFVTFEVVFEKYKLDMLIRYRITLCFKDIREWRTNGSVISLSFRLYRRHVPTVVHTR